MARCTTVEARKFRPSVMILALFMAMTSGAACSPESSSKADGGGTRSAEFVIDGQPMDVRMDGEPWTQSSGALVNGGCYNFLHAGKRIGRGDFHISIRLSLSDPEGARFIFQGNNHLLFANDNGDMVLDGPLFEGDNRILGPSPLKRDTAFVFEVLRSGTEIVFLVDGEQIASQSYESETFGAFGLTPSLGRWEVAICLSVTEMRVIDFRAEGELFPLHAAPPSVELFRQEGDGYHTFRIPAIVRSLSGTLLAFAEGRKNGLGDSGDIDVVLKRSYDKGETWEPLQVVADSGVDTIGNPAPVVDRDTGFIWLALTSNDGDASIGDINNGRNSRDAWITHSEDDGATWTSPEIINDTAKGEDWRWIATGPGHGIQLADGVMVIPCDHSIGPAADEWFSHVMFSDDHGQTWTLGGTVPGGYGDESTVAERLDASLMLNFRSRLGKNRRAYAISTDRGQSWSEALTALALIEPVCEGSLLRLDHGTWEADASGGAVLAFSNPASTRREVMGIHLSRDGGETWPLFEWVHPGPAGYSDMVELADGGIGLLYEKGWLWYSETITFARLTPEWIRSEIANM